MEYSTVFSGKFNRTILCFVMFCLSYLSFFFIEFHDIHIILQCYELFIREKFFNTTVYVMYNVTLIISAVFSSFLLKLVKEVHE